MSDQIRNLEPKALWNHFADLNEVPRPSKKEERVIEFMIKFGQSLGLETYKDQAGNVIIKKAASPGMENRETVVLQSHLDMVHQKNADTVFDFNSEGIRMHVNGDWVEADGTTLGADNGIGVATIMSLLSSDDIVHPPIEALFTIDEETGMTGAIELKGGLLSGKIMLNLDTEDDDELTIGCAGGVDVRTSGTYGPVSCPNGHLAFKLAVKGLTGGHSGMDIHLGRGNANKLMNRLLFGAGRFGLRISSIDGGSLPNAIPRESFAVVAVPEGQAAAFTEYIAKLAIELAVEYKTTDPGLRVVLEPAEQSGDVLPTDFQEKLIRSLYTSPNGIYRMSPDIEDLVQTSNNLARVEVKEGKVYIHNLTRSAVESEKWDLADAIRSAYELSGLDVKCDGSYPGWAPRPEAGIVKLMSGLYTELFGGAAEVAACHAGLECGILGTNYPDMEMISFGPNIRGAHSPDEKVQISSVQKFWKLFTETLKRIPEKA